MVNEKIFVVSINDRIRLDSPIVHETKLSANIVLLTTIFISVFLLFCVTEPCNDIDFACVSSQGCVDKTLVCDGVRQCLDGSDEWECGTHALTL